MLGRRSRQTELLPLTGLLPLLLLLIAACRGEVRVESLVYGSVRIPCWFPFIQGEDSLLVIWEKEGKDGRSMQAYKFVNGRSDLSNQDAQFRGRTDLSGDISRGSLDLTLTGVTMADAGVYYCRAANNIDHGDKMAVLSVSALPPEIIEKAVEDAVTLVPRYSGVPKEITWKKDNDLLVEMESASPKPHFYRLADRADIDRTGNLTIRSLRKEDSGVYTSEVLITRLIQETEIRLSVLDRVSKPTISDRSTGQQIILHCTSPTFDVTYKWVNSSGETVTTGQEYIAPRTRESVLLSCAVNNNVSEDKASVSIPNTPEFAERRRYFIIVFASFVVAIIAAILMYYYRRFLKAENDQRDVTETKRHTMSSERDYYKQNIDVLEGFPKTENDQRDDKKPQNYITCSDKDRVSDQHVEDVEDVEER